MNTGRKFLFACIGVLIGLGVLETGARVVEIVFPPAIEAPARPGWQTTFFASLFDWHEPDPDLLWRFRPDLRAARSPFFYNLGICVLSRGPDSLATVIAPTMAAYPYLDSALQSDYYSLRIKRDYLEVILEVAGQYDLPMVDLPALFARSGGELLFVEHCHPTEQGHRLIAHELCRLMAPSIAIAR